MKLVIFLVGIMVGEACAYGIVLANPPQPRTVLVPYETECELSEHQEVVRITAMLESMPKLKGMLNK